MESQTVNVQLWDTAGPERNDSIQVTFYRGAEACVLVFDITDRESFKGLAGWKSQFNYAADVKENSQFPYFVLGNKSDLLASRKARLGVIDP